jgi:hypothetical protein
MNQTVDWMHAGAHASYAIRDNRIVAVLYWSEAFAGYGQDDDRAGAMIEVPQGWYLVFADAPDELRIVVGPEDADPAMSAAQLEECKREAGEYAATLILGRAGAG